MLLLIKYTLLYGIVLMLVALGGMFSEHSGIINIALEGIMVIGGVAGVLTLTLLPADMSPFLVVLISVLVAALAGIVYSLLAGLCLHQPEGGPDHRRHSPEPAGHRHCRGHRQYFSDSGSAKLNYSNKPFLFSIGGLELSIFLCRWASCCSSSAMWCCTRPASVCVCAPAANILRQPILWASTSTRCATRVCCFPVRWALSAVWHISCPPVQTWNFEVGVAGAGFLALAVMIFGQWKPFNICAAAMFFAVFKSLANIADSTFLAQLHWSSNIYNMMPFIASMIILAFTSKNSMAPKAEGIPYDKGSR